MFVTIVLPGIFFTFLPGLLLEVNNLAVLDVRYFECLVLSFFLDAENLLPLSLKRRFFYFEVDRVLLSLFSFLDDTKLNALDCLLHLDLLLEVLDLCFVAIGFIVLQGSYLVFHVVNT